MNTVQNWREIDRGLRTIAKRRGVLDVEEAALLCLANRTEIWRRFAKPSLIAYLEDVLGYGPKTARDRIRVAIALDEMPVLAEALETGEQSYSALRELTRVVTPNTQREWCDAVRGKNLRQVEELVSVHRRGDLPTDPPNPDLSPRVIRFEVTTATYALLRQAQHILADELGHRLDDNELLARLCSAIIDGGSNPASDDQAGRAKHEVMTTICESCNQGWQQAGGLNIPISKIDVERAECDARRIGSDRTPTRATQDISAKVRRQVHRRDRGACTVPGCRSSRFGEVHHIVPRAAGGGHEAENLTVLCFSHHAALHEGLLSISGRAPDLTFVDRSAGADSNATSIRSAIVVPETSARAACPNPALASHVGRATADARVLEPASALPIVLPELATRTAGSEPALASHVGRTTADARVNEPASDSSVAVPELVARTAGLEPMLACHVGRTTADAPVHEPASDSSVAVPELVTRTARLEPDLASHVGRASEELSASRSTGSPSAAEERRAPSPPSHVGRSSYEFVVMKTEATQALSQAGFKKAVARQMVEEAANAGSPDMTLEHLVRAALCGSRRRF